MTPPAKKVMGVWDVATFKNRIILILALTLLASGGWAIIPQVLGAMAGVPVVKYGPNQEGQVPEHRHRDTEERLGELGDNQIEIATRQKMMMRQLDKQDEKLDRMLEALREKR